MFPKTMVVVGGGESCDGNKALSRSARKLGVTPVYRVCPFP